MGKPGEWCNIEFEIEVLPTGMLHLTITEDGERMGGWTVEPDFVAQIAAYFGAAVLRARQPMKFEPPV
jgi:hypothetical protein